MATRTARAQAAGSTPPVCVFSKHLQFIDDFRELGRTCRELGLDGVDLTVRKGGHVLPEHAATDLPRAVEAIRAEGLDVCMITTNLCRGDDPDAEPILSAASKLGIRYFRVGPHRYSDDGDVLTELDGFTEELRSLAEVAARHDMVAGYHNHSGPRYMGAPLWDLHRAVTAIGRPSFGSNFDVGHATVEGGYGGWRINARLMAPHVKMLAAKDFVWDTTDRPMWVPLGSGRVQLVEFLKLFRQVGFAGPISTHFEYKVPSNEAMLDEIRNAAVTVRAALREAGYA
ncbi:MAG: sugar phosphate isomerase/epimerase [Candidatus Hydrogenedentes bacterium]|nr:sugar phosphate isomerase/epimerase [Candidatus Hydrogenedentota bacterium]